MVQTVGAGQSRRPGGRIETGYLAGPIRFHDHLSSAGGYRPLTFARPGDLHFGFVGIRFIRTGKYKALVALVFQRPVRGE